jgi:hypothetical protein
MIPEKKKIPDPVFFHLYLVGAVKGSVFATVLYSLLALR